MNDNAKAWVKALRSGEYKQAKGRLKEGDAYCCLGVACIVATKGGVEEVPEIAYDDVDLDINFIMVKEWIGLMDAQGRYEVGTKAYYLASDNDSGLSFGEIADIIEANEDKLFFPEATP